MLDAEELRKLAELQEQENAAKAHRLMSSVVRAGLPRPILVKPQMFASTDQIQSMVDAEMVSLMLEDQATYPIQPSKGTVP